MESRRATAHPLRSLIRATALFAAIFSIFGVYLLLRLVTRSSAARARLATGTSRLWYRVAARIFGFRIVLHGPSPPRGALIVSNHVGYADIIAVGASTPTFFVTRTEFLDVPVMGLILKSFDQPAVGRVQAKSLKSVSDQVARYLQDGKTLCAFVEGTSTGGDRVLPFRTPLIQSAISAGAPIVPVGIRWRALFPGGEVSEDLAYWKDHELGPHAWRLLGLGGFEASITFGEPIATAGTDRKKLAALARERVAQIAGLPMIDTHGWEPPATTTS